jgi:2-methylcitrate dehydratase PrpD
VQSRAQMGAGPVSGGLMTEATGEDGNSAQSVTRHVARLGREVAFDALPADVVAIAKHCVLDWLGVTVAGSVEEAPSILRSVVVDRHGAGQATLLGTGESVSILEAALIIGTASHVLDFDDVLSAMGGHPSAPVLSALLPVAEHERLDGRAFLAAFVAGVETEARVGLLVSPSHYDVGWHTTGTVGTFGAAGAVANALRLDEEGFRTSLGLAGTQAAGLKSMFGTMGKPLHAGKAAVNGVLAARLAQQGFVGNRDILDVAQGFATTQSSSQDVATVLGSGPDTYYLRDVLFKMHAACYFTHSSIEGIRRLVKDHHLDVASLSSIELRVPPQHLAACNIAAPTTPLEGKFSLRYTAALALAGRQTDERGFSQEMTADPALIALRDRVQVTPSPEQQNRHASEVVLVTSGGRRLTATVDMSLPARGDAEIARQWERLEAKFLGLTIPVVGQDRAEAAVASVARLDHLDSVDDLLLSVAGP